MNEPVVFQL